MAGAAMTHDASHFSVPVFAAHRNGDGARIIKHRLQFRANASFVTDHRNQIAWVAPAQSL